MREKKPFIISLYVVLSALLILLDQVTKNMAVAALKGKPNYIVINRVFELEYLENTGAAFSSFTGKQGFLLIFTTIILAFCIVEFVRIPSLKRYGLLRFTFLLLISGAIGNMIDRVKQGYVVDFFYFTPINFPRFNVADIYVTCSVILLIILMFFVYKDEELEFLLKFKK